MIPIAILAGGMATRLGKLSESKPKSLIETAGRPFIDWQLDLLEKAGITSVYLLVSHFSNQIVDHLATREKKSLQIQCLVDGPVPAGTGGALLANYDSLPEIFFLMYGDSYLDIDYKAMYEYFLEQDLAYLMAVCKTPLNEVAISNAEVANGKVVQFSKNQFSIRMEYEDFGLSILRREILTPFLSNKNCDLSTITEKLAFEGKVGSYIVNDKYYEVGSSQGISDFEKHMGAL